MMASSAGDRLLSVRMRRLSADVRPGCASPLRVDGLCPSEPITRGTRDLEMVSRQAPEAEPGLAARADLLLPDRRAFFQAIDGGAARLERGRAVRRRRRDGDGDLAHRERADAVMDRDLGPDPLALDLLGDLGQHLLRHLDVRLVFQADDVGQMVALPAHDAGERHDPAPVRAADGGDGLVDDERLGADGDLARSGATRDGRQQGDLVALRQRRGIGRPHAVDRGLYHAAAALRGRDDVRRWRGGRRRRRRRRVARGSRAPARRARGGRRNRGSRRSRRAEV